MLISYLVAGTLIILVMWALGEMAAANPDSGAFSVYTAKAYGPVAGATVGWLWWLQLVVVIAAEALGAAGLLATNFPALGIRRGSSVPSRSAHVVGQSGTIGSRLRQHTAKKIDATFDAFQARAVNRRS